MAELQLLVRIVSRTGEERIIEVTPGGSTPVKPGDQIFLIGRQAPDAQLIQDGNDLKIAFGGEDVFMLEDYFEHMPTGLEELVLVTDATEVATYIAAAADAAANAEAQLESLVQLGQAPATDLTGEGIQPFWATDPDITVSEGGWDPFPGLAGPDGTQFLFAEPVTPPAPGPTPPTPPGPAPPTPSAASTPEPEIPDLPPHIPIEELTDGENGIIFEGGWVVSWLNDINGDGYDDIIIGSPNYGPHQLENGSWYREWYYEHENSPERYPSAFGRAYVVFGDPEMDIAELNPVQLETDLDGSNGFIVDYDRYMTASITKVLENGGDVDWDGLGVYDNPGALGWDVADAGDVNGDGITDFIVTAPGFGWGEPASLFVIFGNDAETTPWSTGMLDLDLIIGQNSEFPAEFGFQILPGCECCEYSFAISAHGVGDVNGDGIDDFIIGSPHGHFTDYGPWPPAFDVENGEASTLNGPPYDYYDGGMTYLVYGREEWYSHYDPASSNYEGEWPPPYLDGLRIVHSGFYLTRGVASEVTVDNGNGQLPKPPPDWDMIHNLGFDVSGFGDFNGDGIGDMLIGAPDLVDWNYGGGPYESDYEDTTYVVFGGGEFDWDGSTVLDLADLNGGEIGDPWGFIVHGVDYRDPVEISFQLYLNDQASTWYVDGEGPELDGEGSEGPYPFWYPWVPGKYPDAGPATLEWYTNGQFGPEGIDAYLEWDVTGHLEAMGYLGYFEGSYFNPYYNPYASGAEEDLYFGIYADLATNGVLDISYGPDHLDGFIEWYLDGGVEAYFEDHYHEWNYSPYSQSNDSEHSYLEFMAWLHSQGIAQIGEDSLSYIPEDYDGFGSEHVPQGWEAFLVGYFGYESSEYEHHYQSNPYYSYHSSWDDWMEGYLEAQTSGDFLTEGPAPPFYYMGQVDGAWELGGGWWHNGCSDEWDCGDEFGCEFDGEVGELPWPQMRMAGAWESAGLLEAQGEIIVEYYDEMETANSGWSVSFAGDVNGDGYQDVIIGAPEAEMYKASVVYVDVMAQFGAYLYYQDLTELPPEVQTMVFGDVLPTEGLMLSGGSMPEMGDIMDYLEFLYMEGMLPDIDPQEVDPTALAAAYGIEYFELPGPEVIDLTDPEIAVQFDAWFQANYVDAFMNAYEDGAAYVVFGGPDVGEIWLDELDGSNGFAIANDFGWSQQLNEGIAAAYEGTVTTAEEIPCIGGIDEEFSGGVELLAPEEGGEPLTIWTSLFLDYNPELDGEEIPIWEIADFGDGENLGWSVSGGGDINGDGIADMIVGAPEAHDGYESPHLGAGATFVIFGVDTTDPDYDPTTNPWEDGIFTLSEIDGANGFELIGIDPSDNSGASVAMGTTSDGDPAGDFNDDGFSDILVGAPLAGYEGEEEPLEPSEILLEEEEFEGPLPDGDETGEAYLILGGSNGLGGEGGLDPETIEEFEYPDVDPLDPLLYQEMPPEM